MSRQTLNMTVSPGRRIQKSRRSMGRDDTWTSRSDWMSGWCVLVSLDVIYKYTCTRSARETFGSHSARRRESLLQVTNSTHGPRPSPSEHSTCRLSRNPPSTTRSFFRSGYNTTPDTLLNIHYLFTSLRMATLRPSHGRRLPNPSKSRRT